MSSFLALCLIPLRQGPLHPGTCCFPTKLAAQPVLITFLCPYPHQLSHVCSRDLDLGPHGYHVSTVLTESCLQTICIVSLMHFACLFRWQRAVSSHLAKQNVLVPKEESLNESDVGFHEGRSNRKRNLVKKMKSAVGKMLSCKCGSQSANAGRESFVEQKEAVPSNTQGLLPRLVKELPSPGLFTKPRMRKLSQTGNQWQFSIKWSREMVK